MKLLLPVLLFYGLTISIGSNGQANIIEGKVLDESLRVANGTRIINKSTGEEVFADQNGKFNISSEPGDTLTFQFVGLTPEIRIVERSDKKINIILMDKEVNCLGALWKESDYKKAYRNINKRYKELYSLAEKNNLWNK